MPLLEGRALVKLYGAETVLDEVTLVVDRGERIGLVGANGSGKTTLCRLLLGQEEPTAGTVTLAAGATVGYLSQSPELDPTRTVFAEAMAVFEPLHRLEAELAEAAEALAEPGLAPAELDRRLHRQAELLHDLEARGGFDYEQRLLATLGALGLGPSYLDRPVGQLSGGEKSRLALAKLLQQGCDLLLLDEPTNHLDIGMTEWLEGFLRTYPGGVIIVSHDRWFLDHVCHQIAELEGGRLTLYRFGVGEAKLPPPDEPEFLEEVAAHQGHYGAYTHFTRVKAQRRAAEWKAWLTQQKELQRQEAWIRWKLSLRRGRHVAEARSRQKRLDKLDRVDRPTDDLPVVTLDFEPRHRGPNDVALLRDATFGYGGEPLFEGVELVVRRLERVGVVGPNGCGKSSLLRLLLGELRPTAGVARLGETCEVGYYHQEHRGLDLNSCPLEELRRAAPELTVPQIRGFLARFLFFGDDVFRPVHTFSGGERSRLVLAKLIAARPNVLILDEPTNHLDIPSREVLEEALLRFQGTILCVSHDRWFLDRLCRRLLVWEDGRATVYEGRYSEREAAREAARQQAEAAAENERRQRHRAHLAREKEARRLKQAQLEALSGGRTLAQVEAALEVAEARLAELHARYGEPDFYADGAAVKAAQQEEARLRAEIAELTSQWEALVEAGA